MSSSKYLKIFAVMAVIALIGLAVGASFNRSASAQSAASGINPPFTFHETVAANSVEVGFPPIGGSVIFTETFGPSFAPTTTLVTSTPMWHAIINPDATSDYYWGRVLSVTNPFSNTAWNAASSITGTALNPGVDPYPANQDTWLIYGPLDLSHYASAQLLFDYYLDSQTGDELSWGSSSDGTNFSGSSLSGHLSSGSQWYSGTLDFSNLARHNDPVYIAFAFKSGGSPSGLGAFIRNLKIVANPLKYVYLPLALMNYTPPPPPPLFGYYFDDSGADLAHWGGAFYNLGTTKYGQCMSAQCTVPVHAPVPHGNPGDSLRLFTNGLYRFVASSPNDIMPDSFDLYMDISPVVLYPRDAGCVLYGCPSNDLGDWYGIIFNASGDTFGSNPSQFAYNKQYYILYFYNIDATTPIAVNLDRCDGSSDPASNSCTTLGHSSLPSYFIGNSAGFDTIHITRDISDGTIKVKVDGTTLINVQDNAYKGSSYGKYGAFIFSWDKNDTGSLTGAQMQVDFDNVKVYSR